MRKKFSEETIVCFAAYFPLHLWHKDVCLFLNTLPDDATVAVACSGGADSVAVLILLWRYFPRLRDRLLVLHFDHALRGKDSEADAVFVESLARFLKLRFIGGKRNDSRSAESIGEKEAREARMAFFAKAVSEEKSTEAFIFTGHHADDLAETILMRLARGSGTEGLCAPRAISTGEHGLTFLRPLLTISSGQIREKLRECGLPWCEDATNAENDFLRNRLRHTMLPSWQLLCSHDLLKGLNRSRDLLEEDAVALGRQASNVFSENMQPNGELILGENLPLPAILRRVLDLFYAEYDLHGSLNAQAKDRILHDILFDRENEGKWSCGENRFLVLSDKRLSLQTGQSEPEKPFSEEFILESDGSIELPYGLLSARKVTLDDSLRRKILSGAFSPEETVYLSADFPFLVRSRRPGDSFQPLGAPGKKRLHDMFIDRKIDAYLRSRLPVITLLDGSVIWVPMLIPADFTKINNQTETSIELTYQPFL